MQTTAAPKRGADPEDEKALAEIRRRIRKVIQARGWNWPDEVFDEIIERVTELQELQEQKQRIDTTMQALESYKPEYARLLRLRYIEEKQPAEVASEMNISDRTYRSWRMKAELELNRLAV